MLHFSYNGITASIDGKVVGVIVWIDQKDSRRIWLQLGYVVPEHRGKGIYGHLWRALIDKARELQRPAIWSATGIDNYRMREVAKKQGRAEVAVSLKFDVA
jgi:GNAT superfamily N-acetyltransferase